MLKVHEILILRELENGPSYSYKIARELGLNPSSSAYSLNRLENAGYCKGRIEDNTSGPHRVYFRITDKGRNTLRKDALLHLKSTQREAEKMITSYTQHQRTIQLLREIGGL